MLRTLYLVIEQSNIRAPVIKAGVYLFFPVENVDGRYSLFFSRFACLSKPSSTLFDVYSRSVFAACLWSNRVIHKYIDKALRLIPLVETRKKVHYEQWSESLPQLRYFPINRQRVGEQLLLLFLTSKQ